MIISNAQMHDMSALALAHYRGAVYELLVRTELCRSGRHTASELHRQTCAMSPPGPRPELP
jgi:23S rRNA maturation mini-RNase III